MSAWSMAERGGGSRRPTWQGAGHVRGGETHVSNAGLPRVVAGWPQIWNYCLQGDVGYEFDREFAEVLQEELPHLAWLARARLMARRRLAEYLAGSRGVTQFVVVGTDLPVDIPQHLPADRPYAAEIGVIVQEIDPAARTVYVCDDPLVAERLRALERSGRGWGCRSVLAAGDPASVLAAAFEELCASSTIAVVMIGALEHLDDQAARAALGAYAGMLAPGSFLAVAHLTASAQVAAALTALCAAYGVPVPYLRGPEEINALLADVPGGGEVRVIGGGDPHVSGGIAVWSAIARIGGGA